MRYITEGFYLEFPLTYLRTPGGGGYGQNIATYGTTGTMISLSTAVARAITNLWYDSELMNFPVNGYGQATPDLTNFSTWGHYTQVIWKSSTRVGCASWNCPAGTIFSTFPSVFTVCNYAAAGEHLHLKCYRTQRIFANFSERQCPNPVWN